MRIGSPRLVIGLDVDALEPSHVANVEIMRAAIVFDGLPADHHPALRHLMAPEHLILQELVMAGRKRLRNAIDFVEEQNPSRRPFLHAFIYRRDDSVGGVPDTENVSPSNERRDIRRPSALWRV
ncbi:MAG: hypothetical protein ACLT98_10270 [Eggerthellaceae bacterium]